MKSEQKQYLQIVDVFDGELADGASGDWVVRRREDGVDELSVDDVTGWLDLVEVERVSAGHWTVEAALEKCCPKQTNFVALDLHSNRI